MVTASEIVQSFIFKQNSAKKLSRSSTDVADDSDTEDELSIIAVVTHSQVKLTKDIYITLKPTHYEKIGYSLQLSTSF